MRTRKAFLCSIGFMVSEFEECFPEEVDSPEMELIMKVVEELEMVVEQGAEFLPVFPPPQAPGVRERALFRALSMLLYRMDSTTTTRSTRSDASRSQHIGDRAFASGLVFISAQCDTGFVGEVGRAPPPVKNRPEAAALWFGPHKNNI